ncbi:glycosyltransferase family 4 protein, partial [Aidingimonas halophila]
AIIPDTDSLSGKRKSVHNEVIDGVSVKWVRSSKNNRKSFFSRCLYFISSSFFQVLAAVREDKPKIVIATSMPLSSVLLSYFYARVVGAKYIIDVRDTHIDSAIATGVLKSGFLSSCLLRIESAIFKRADANIVVTKRMGKMLKDKGVSESKLFTSYLGYDGIDVYKEYTDWSRDIREELGLKGKFLVLYTGTLGKVFDIDTIIHASNELKNNKDIVFVFLGSGYREDEVRAYVEREGCNCIFLGSVPKYDVPLICSVMDLAIYAVKPSVSLEAIAGNKVFDYIGSGLPIANANTESEVSDIIKEYKVGFSVAAQDYKALAENIDFYAKNPKELNEFKDRAIVCSNEELSTKNQMNRFLEVINMVAN